MKLPAPADLVAAVHGGDDVEIERVAARLGAVRLEAWAEHGKPPERLAALRALPLVDDAWAVLPELAHAHRRRRRRGGGARGASARGASPRG